MAADKARAGAGVEWFKGGWEIFKTNGLVWVLITLVLFVVAMALQFVPVIGGIAFMVILPVLISAMFRIAAGDEPPEIGSLLRAFQDARRRTPLMLLGLILFAVSLGLSLTVGLALFGPMADLVVPGAELDPQVLIDHLFRPANLVVLLVLILVQLVVGFGFLFAVGLVTFDGAAPVTAFGDGLKGAFSNLLPLIVFGVIYTVLAIVAAIPFGLGFLVLVPVTMLAGYRAYRDLFGAQITA
jgi:hypothetical protein